MRLRYLTPFCALAGVLIVGWAAGQPEQPGAPARGGQPNRGAPGRGGRAAPVVRTAWEYRVLARGQIQGLAEREKDSLTAGLNKLGAEGWELVTIDRGADYVFKRPVNRGGRGWPTASAEPPLAAQGTPAAAASDLRVFRLKNAVAADMERILSKLFPTGGFPPGVVRAGAFLRIASDARTNSVLASGPREQMDEIEAVLNRLDTPEGAEGVKTPTKK